MDTAFRATTLISVDYEKFSPDIDLLSIAAGRQVNGRSS
jgi:hypothetical protein